MLKASIALFLALMLVGPVSLYGTNIFHTEDSFHTALSNAKTNQKLLLTYASRPKSICCKAMDKVTFLNQEITSILTSSFYPVKINLNNKIGQNWANKFNIVHSPTLLFFDDQGNLIQQIETAVSSKELLSILNQVIFYNNNGYWPMEISQPIVLSSIVPDYLLNSDFKPKQNTNNENEFIPVNNKSTQVFTILLDEIPTKDPSASTTIKEVKRKFPNQPVSVKLLKTKESALSLIHI